MLSETFRKQLNDLHQTQIFNIEIDIIFTVIVSYWISITYNRNFTSTLISIILISIIIHRIFRINTFINRLIFGNV